MLLADKLSAYFFFPSQMSAISSWIGKIWGVWGKELGCAHIVNIFPALILPVSVSQMYSWHKETVNGENANVKDHWGCAVLLPLVLASAHLVGF